MSYVPLPPGVIPRPEVLDVYWHFAAERQNIFFRRLHGQPAPWTDDPILATHKFCNSYRAADRVSQALLREVIYSDEGQTYDLANTAFRILLFKLFNRPETWHWLQQRLGPLHLGMFEVAPFDEALTEANRHFPIYTSAYISCASPAFGHRRTHQNHLALLQHMFRADALPDKLEKIILSQAKTGHSKPQTVHFGLPLVANVNVLHTSKNTPFGQLFKLLRGYPLLGDFMAYQLATDLNYSRFFQFSEADFTAPGPGALRGIRKCFVSLGEHSPSAIIHWMQANQQQEFAARGLGFQSLYDRPLQLIDCQGLFCETDKYTRSSHPDLLSLRRRIKHRFTPTPEPIRYVFPPHWNLNQS